MEAFIIWILMIWGAVNIITRTSLFNVFRHKWHIKAKLQASVWRVGKWYWDLPKQLIDCWICLAFWLGIISSLMGLSTFINPILGGLAAVGGVGILELIWVRRTDDI